MFRPDCMNMQKPILLTSTPRDMITLMDTTVLPHRQPSAREQYLRIHKHLVGPKTAERLFLLYQELAGAPYPEHLHMAGWAAAEAALVSSGRPTDERLSMLDCADDAWARATDISRLHAAQRSTTPNRTSELRSLAPRLFIPSMKSIVRHDFSHEEREACFDSVLDLAMCNLAEMRDASLSGDTGRYGNHFGFAHELTSVLATNRLLSGRIFTMPSLARAGTGENYPTKTHDIQVAYLRRGKFTKVVPMEVKTRMSITYDLPVISARKHLRTATVHDITSLYEAYALERTNQASDEQRALAQASTDILMHLITHHHHAETLGIHCMRLSQCMPQRYDDNHHPATMAVPQQRIS